MGPEASTPHSTVHQHEQTDLEFLKGARGRYRLRRAHGSDRAALRESDGSYRRRSSAAASAVSACGALAAWLASPDGVRPGASAGMGSCQEKEIIGKARQDTIGLSRAASRIEPPASIVDLGLVEALQSAAAAHAVAKGALSANTEQDLSAEMAVDGDATLRARAEIILEGAGDAFNGKYLVQGVSTATTGARAAVGGRCCASFVKIEASTFCPRLVTKCLSRFRTAMSIVPSSSARCGIRRPFPTHHRAGDELQTSSIAASLEIVNIAQTPHSSESAANIAWNKGTGLESPRR